MKTVFCKRIFAIILLLVIIVIGSGCSRYPAKFQPYKPGKVFIAPVRDVIQNGGPHEKGVGSGAAFLTQFQQTLGASDFEVVTTDSKEFCCTEIASKEQILAEGKKLKADYSMQIVLGKFLDAAPMTFRADYAYLDKAVMYKTETGETVWELTNPRVLQKGNPGSYLVLILNHAMEVSRSITGNVSKE